MSFILFLLILAVLIFVHELGHFIVAKLSGIRVDEFALGFPPTIMKKRVGETVYKLNIVPFGGYVSIFGENPDNESMNGPDANRSMMKKNRGIQAAVLVAGVACNIIFAWILISITLALGISPTASFTNDAPQQVGGKVLIDNVLKDSPAAKAGFQIGDVVYKVTDSKTVLTDSDPSIEEVQKIISEDTAKKELTFSVYRNNNESKEIKVTPVSGVAGDKFAIGISMDSGELIQVPWYKAPIQGAITTVRATVLTAQGLFNFVVAGFQGKADFGQVSGPVGIVGLVGNASASGLAYILFFTALISINLAVINILPFPALDGGRLLFVVIEAITRRSISPRIMNGFNAVGFVLLISLMLFVTYHDIVKMFFK